jgi:hypothetical protein
MRGVVEHVASGEKGKAKASGDGGERAEAHPIVAAVGVGGGEIEPGACGEQGLNAAELGFEAAVGPLVRGGLLSPGQLGGSLLRASFWGGPIGFDLRLFSLPLDGERLGMG